MTVRCSKCNGIIPDVIFGDGDRNNCRHHIRNGMRYKI